MGGGGLEFPTRCPSRGAVFTPLCGPGLSPPGARAAATGHHPLRVRANWVEVAQARVGEIDQQDPATPSLAAVHPIGVEHDVLNGCCSASFLVSVAGWVGEREEVSRCGAVCGLRRRPLRSRSADVLTLAARVPWGVVGACGWVCALSGELWPDWIWWQVRLGTRGPGSGEECSGRSRGWRYLL